MSNGWNSSFQGKLTRLRMMVVRMIEEIDNEIKSIEARLHGYKDVYRVSFDINVVKDYGYVRLRLIGFDGSTIRTMNIGRIDLIDDVGDLKRLLRHKLWFHGYMDSKLNNDNGLSPDDIINIRSLHERKRKLTVLRSNLKHLLTNIDEAIQCYQVKTNSFDHVLQRLREKAKAKGII